MILLGLVLLAAVAAVCYVLGATAILVGSVLLAFAAGFGYGRASALDRRPPP